MGVFWLICLSAGFKYFFAGIEPVHFRHLEVHEDELKGSVGAIAGQVQVLFEDLEGLESIVSLLSRYAIHGLNESGERQKIELVVIY